MCDSECRELREGQQYLQVIVEHQNIPIFDKIPVALTCVARVLRNGTSPQQLYSDNSAVSVRSTHLRSDDKQLRLKEVFDSLDNHNSGAISLTDLRLAFRILTGRELSRSNMRQIAVGKLNGQLNPEQDLRTKNLDEVLINFDHFSCIVNEFESDISTNIGDNVANKLETIAEPVNKLFEWFFKPNKSAINSAKSAPHMPYETNFCDIYLGGASSPFFCWKKDIAIPLLRSVVILVVRHSSEYNQ